MAQLSGQPVIILPQGTTRTTGRQVQRNNIAVAVAIADAVRSTLGPKGMDKMLVDELGDVTLTNDGAKILTQMNIEHPTGKMLVEVAKTQEDEVGDGTTTAVVLAGELLKKALDLIDQKIHPSVIINGYRLASSHSLDNLKKLSSPLKDSEKEILRQIALTSMTGKEAETAKEELAEVIIEAVRRVSGDSDGKKTVDRDSIQVEKKEGASLADTKLIQGIIIDKERVHSNMPVSVEEAKIAIVNSAFEIKKTETDAKVRITDPSQLQAFIDQEERMLKEMVDKVVEAGANVLFCQKGIDDIAQYYLAKAGVFAVRRVKESDMEKLAKATGARIVTRIKDINSKDLGYAKQVFERKIAGDEMTFVEGCKSPKAVSILIRGGTEHVLAEAERAVEDALGAVSAAVEDGSYLFGAGSSDVDISLALRDYAKTVGGREQLAIEAYADALEVVPRTLAESAGMDPIDTMVELRAAHKKKQNMGIDVINSKLKDAKQLRVIEPSRVKRQAISSASDVAEMILRIDDMIASKARPMPAGPPGGGGMGGMPPGMGGMGGMM